MQEFPLELINAIVKNVSSTNELLCLRPVNKYYRDLVTPLTFKKLHLKNSIQSAHNCQQIISTPSLAIHVRDVVYDSRENRRFQFPLDNADIDDPHQVADLEETLIDAFCAITALPSLERIVVNFWPSFISHSGKEVHESPFWFTSRQLTIIHAIYHGLNTSHLTSLSLNNVVVMPPSCYDFVSSLTNSPLSHLSVSFVSNGEISAWSGSKDANGSIGALLPPSNPALKSLALFSPHDPYHSLTTQLSSLYYPSLEYLSLANIIFEDTVEDFILRHKRCRIVDPEVPGCFGGLWSSNGRILPNGTEPDL